MLVHQLRPPGLTSEFVVYPPLLTLIAGDLGILGHREPTVAQVERALQELDTTSRFAEGTLGLGSYYDAASFVDLVYRIFTFLQDNPEKTPVWPLVVVDEYQDFTRLETAFIQQFRVTSPLLIAGDDDQALYGFRFASPEYIRALATQASVERHELPFCSRCTTVIVDAVNSTISRATAEGSLRGRLAKPFVCYLPEKAEASARHPTIHHARCSIHRYMALYVEDEIARIPDADVEESVKRGHLTALVVGRTQFVQPVFRRLKDGSYPQTQERRSPTFNVEPIDGYRLLARDPQSNLGWRILVHVAPFEDWDLAVEAALALDEPLIERLPQGYVEGHTEIAMLLAKASSRQDLEAHEARRLARALGIHTSELAGYLVTEDIEVADESVATRGGTDEEEPATRPSILCTSLVGAKGLSAEHVFVVGCMNGFFPVNSSYPTDDEIREFIVALSRTRAACHLVSCKVYVGPGVLQPSEFISWIAGHVTPLDVNAAYWKKRAAESAN